MYISPLIQGVPFASAYLALQDMVDGKVLLMGSCFLFIYLESSSEVVPVCVDNPVLLDLDMRDSTGDDTSS